jgi:hypothetical protein
VGAGEHGLARGPLARVARSGVEYQSELGEAFRGVEGTGGAPRRAVRPRARAAQRNARQPGTWCAPANDELALIAPPVYFLTLAGVRVPDAGGMVRCPLPDHDDAYASCQVLRRAERRWWCYGCSHGGRATTATDRQGAGRRRLRVPSVARRRTRRRAGRTTRSRGIVCFATAAHAGDGGGPTTRSESRPAMMSAAHPARGRSVSRAAPAPRP